MAYCSLAIPLQLAQRLRPIPPNKQLFVVLVELYGFTWFLLVGATILTRRINIAGLYWIAFWNASLLVAVVLGMSESLWGKSKVGGLILHRREGEGDQGTQTGEQQETEASETTPLLQQHASQTSSESLASDEQDKDFWEIFQFILSSAAPVLNLATIYSIWINAMPQTIPDGGSVGIGMWCFLLRLGSVAHSPAVSVCTYLATVVPYSSSASALRAQGSPLAHCRRPFRFHRIYHLCLARSSFHPQRAYQGVLCTEN